MSDLYFKVAKVKGKYYLQIWNRINNKCFHIGSAEKILKLVGVSQNVSDAETKLTNAEDSGLTFQDVNANEKD